MPSDPCDLSPYDTVLLQSFGGPEAPDDVMPFLRTVTAGRGIPDERLAEVAEHYLHLGGRSPINDQNRALVEAMRAELAARGCHEPVVWGNRNWVPYLGDALRDAHGKGGRRIVVVVTSAYSSYSGCRQYREDVAAAVLALAAEGRQVEVDKVRHYFNHPGFVAAQAEAVRAAQAQVPDGARLVFVTHSVPVAMDDASGPPEGGGHAYVRQHRSAAAAVTRQVGADDFDLVFCSRSGPPSQPWLEPDVGDHLRALAGSGAAGAVVVPIGFVSDHMEVVYDLDTEAAAVAAAVGLPFARAGTVGTHPAFVAALVDLLGERAAQRRGEDPPRPTVGDLGASHAVCPAWCCRNPRGELPAACGQDWVAPVLRAG